MPGTLCANVPIFPRKHLYMELDDRAWGLLNGGYRIPYDASKPLKKLKGILSQKERREIFNELWENLHHEGNVGLASYLAIPHLIDICIENKSLDRNFIGLCVTIENCRTSKGENPEIPSQYATSILGRSLDLRSISQLISRI